MRGRSNEWRQHYPEGQEFLAAQIRSKRARSGNRKAANLLRHRQGYEKGRAARIDPPSRRGRERDCSRAFAVDGCRIPAGMARSRRGPVTENVGALSPARRTTNYTPPRRYTVAEASSGASASVAPAFAAVRGSARPTAVFADRRACPPGSASWP